MRTVWKIIIAIIVLASIYLLLGNLLNFSMNSHALASSPDIKHVSTDSDIKSSGVSSSEKAPVGSPKSPKHPSSPKAASRVKPNVES